MKKFIFRRCAGAGACVFFGILFLSFLTACQSIREGHGQGETRVFEVTPEVAFEAAEQALEGRGFLVVEKEPAQGKMRALSPIRREPGLQTVTQREVIVSFRERAEGETELDVRILLVEENLFRFETPLATRVFLDRSPLYSLVFSDIEHEIDNLLAPPENQ